MSIKNKLLGPNPSLSQQTRLVILILGIILLIANFWLVDFEQLLSRENVGEGLGIISNLFIIAAMAASMKHAASEKEKNKKL